MQELARSHCRFSNVPWLWPPTSNSDHQHSYSLSRRCLLTFTFHQHQISRPGDSKWHFQLLIWRSLNPLKSSLNHPQRSLWITRGSPCFSMRFVFLLCVSPYFSASWPPWRSNVLSFRGCSSTTVGCCCLTSCLLTVIARIAMSHWGLITDLGWSISLPIFVWGRRAF